MQYELIYTKFVWRMHHLDTHISLMQENNLILGYFLIDKHKSLNEISTLDKINQHKMIK